VFTQGEIVFVFEFTEEMVGFDVGREIIIPLHGLFALIKLLEAPLAYPRKWSELVVKGSKCLTRRQ
jgi:hypothetical protein